MVDVPSKGAVKTVLEYNLNIRHLSTDSNCRAMDCWIHRVRSCCNISTLTCDRNTESMVGL